MKKLLLVALVLLGLQTQAQTWNYCDSINLNMTVTEDTALTGWFQYWLNGTYTGQTHNDSLFGDSAFYMYAWTIQNLSVSPPCPELYVGNNIYVTLPSSIYDTLKICWTVDLMWTNCTVCDTLVYSTTGNSPFNGNWIFIGDMSSPTAIQEFKNNLVSNNKMYDLLGREITEVPIGTMYIKNGKQYMMLPWKCIPAN